MNDVRLNFLDFTHASVKREEIGRANRSVDWCSYKPQCEIGADAVKQRLLVGAARCAVAQDANLMAGFVVQPGKITHMAKYPTDW